MKKLITVLPLSLFILVLSACGGSDDEQTEIEFYFPVAVGGDVANIVESLVDDFEEENPDIKVNEKFGGSYEETMTQVMADTRAGNPPELSVLFSIDLFTLIENDAIEELTPEFDEDLLDDFYDGFMANSTIDDEVWSLPFQRSTIVLYYNKDAFEEAGLDPDDPPEDWDELVEYGEELTIDDGDSQWGLEIPGTDYQYWMLQSLALQTEDNIMSDDGKETYFDADYTQEAMQFYQDVGQKYEISPKGVLDWETVPSDFKSGDTAMMYHTTGNLTNVKDEADFDFGVSFLPANNQYGSATGGGNIYLFKDIPEENRDAAVKFMEFLTEPERLAQWSIDTGYVAPREASYETDLLKDYIDDFPPADVARDQLEYADSELSTYENGKVQKELNDDIQSILSGEYDVGEGLEKAQEAAEETLDPFQDD